MLTNSTSTLIDVVNDVLLDVGERAVTNLSSPVARKAVKYVQDGVREMQRFHNWDWLYSRVTPTTWANEMATLSNVNRILYVSWSGVAALRRLEYLDPETFDATVMPKAFVSSETPSDTARYYTIVSRNVLKVSPYPTDLPGRAKLQVYVLLDMVPPRQPNDVFPIPEDNISLLNKYATSMMYLHHLDDSVGASTLMSSFSEQLAYVRTRESKHPAADMNMYRRSRRYTR
jgi:hypothetical protein